MGSYASTGWYWAWTASFAEDAHPYLWGLYYAILGIAHTTLHRQAYLAYKAQTPKSRCYDPVLKMLADEQGDWYVEKVLSHELGKVLTHNTRDLDTATEHSSPRSDSLADSESEASTESPRSTAEPPHPRTPLSLAVGDYAEFFEPAELPPPKERRPTGRKKAPVRPARLPRGERWQISDFEAAYPPMAGTGGEPPFGPRYGWAAQRFAPGGGEPA